MQFMIYRLTFPVGAHFGAGALWDGMSTLPADTFFSALCQEAIDYGGQAEVNMLVDAVRQGDFRVSDLFPFIGDELYLPKPFYPVAAEQEGNSIIKKSFKKLKYIPASKWKIYLQGNLNPVDAVRNLGQLGRFTMRTMSASRAPEKLDSGDMLPYQVGIYQFYAGSGLYLIAGFADDILQTQFETLLHGLSFSGLGGKRSAGLGRFSVAKSPVPNHLLHRFRGTDKNAMALSVCMAEPDMLESILEDARYLLLKRSGFIASPDYAPELRRKRDFYSFCAGSCFKKRFAGDVYDVGGSGTHPVYRYVAALWMEM